MNKEEILSEIKEFREAFNKIKPDQFYFGNFVNEYSADRTCGTVCCLWGWIPQIAPEIASRYNLYYDLFRISDMSQTPNILNWPNMLMKYLFYPNYRLSDFDFHDEETSLSKILKDWDDVIFALEKTERLDYLF